MKGEDMSLPSKTDEPSDNRRAPRCPIFHLYVAGNTPCSLRALRNFKRLGDAHLHGIYRLEVIDIHQRPDLATAAQIVAVPTLVRSRPSPSRRIIGDLSDSARFCASLGLTSHE
jgi:circadian clock protein KaiB